MNFLKTTLLAAAATVAVASAAQAADPIMPVPVTPVAPAPSIFDWNGLYAGVRVGVENNTATTDSYGLVGLEIGANAAFDMFVLGGELAVDYLFATSDFAYVEGTVRAGVALAPQVLLYGTVGYGSDLDSVGSGDHILAGLGAEFAVADSVSLDARYVHGWEQGSGSVNAGDIHKFTIGANFHF
ncbi:outer membrane protein [Pelagibacterium lacus]|uniref:Porin family protein n=1 Tax=Pelagibacterium lacus TaxID=2282655 RepID=A0A369W3E5_9HYPH|nr:outer membrane beta-barrel protein [Pelagibacterium lacus]RDE09204.1 porin family protein [Pelagibacterium lacus]